MINILTYTCAVTYVCVFQIDEDTYIGLISRKKYKVKSKKFVIGEFHFCDQTCRIKKLNVSNLIPLPQHTTMYAHAPLAQRIIASRNHKRTYEPTIENL